MQKDEHVTKILCKLMSIWKDCKAQRGGILPSIAIICTIIATSLGLVACHPSIPQIVSCEIKPTPLITDTLHAQFFGTTTIQIDDGRTAIMIDGFFSRPGLVWLALSWIFPILAPDETRINAALREGNVPKLEAVLVAHSHHDHAMDSAVVAEQREATLVGSQSTDNIGRGRDLPDKKRRIPNLEKDLEFDGFRIKLFNIKHSESPPFMGEIIKELRPPARISDYKEGGEYGNYSFLIKHNRGNVLVHPSANLVGTMYKDVKADVIFLSIGALGNQSKDFARDYWRQVVMGMATKPKLVVPIHWDDFFRPLPLNDQPLLPMPYPLDNVEVALKYVFEFSKEDNVRVRFMPPFKSFNLIEAANALNLEPAPLRRKCEE